MMVRVGRVENRRHKMGGPSAIERDVNKMTDRPSSASGIAA